MPAFGLGKTDRPFATGGIGYAPISVFVWFDTWIQVAGIEPLPQQLTGLEGTALLHGVRTAPPRSGAVSSFSRTGTAPPVLGARDSSPPLAGESGVILSPSDAAGARLSSLANNEQLFHKGQHPLEGTEYDDEIEGKERGWPKN